MYQVLHFEDWTNDLTIATLDQKGLPHVGRVIKVFATKSDPRGVYRRPDLRVLPVPDEEFSFSEQYDYPNRNYNGHELEADLNRLSLDDVGKRTVRALFRFANSPEMRFCQRAMMATRPDGTWLIDHPFADIDGIVQAEKDPKRTNAIHLDVFLPQSIQALRKIVDLKNSLQILPAHEGLNRRLEEYPLTEGFRLKERG